MEVGAKSRARVLMIKDATFSLKAEEGQEAEQRRVTSFPSTGSNYISRKGGVLSKDVMRLSK